MTTAFSARPVNLVASVHPDTVADLLVLHDRLTAAGVEIWLVRRRRGVAVAVVDSPAGADLALRKALAELRRDGLDWVQAAPGIIRVGSSADTGRWIDVECWTVDAGTVICPRANALTRERFDSADIEPTTVDIFDRRWPTLAGMFTAHTNDVGFDIDVVFSWVDGTDPALRSRRAEWLPGAVLGDGDDADARVRQIDELRYALRSVDQNAPWVRRIFIVTDSRLPSWLVAEHPKVRVVRAHEHFRDLNALPTFNSHAVESQLHHIDGLAEHFLYCNDDMFFARPLAPSMFFTAAGISKFVESPVRIGGGAAATSRSGHENAARNNRRLLADRFGYAITRHLAHSPAPMRRSVLAELETEFAAEFAATQAARFRSATDISVTNSLYHYYALLTGRAVQHESARASYVDTTSHAGLRQLAELAARRNADFFCLNDGSEPEVDEAHREATVSGFLADYFPNPAPWERDERRVFTVQRGRRSRQVQRGELAAHPG